MAPTDKITLHTEYSHVDHIMTNHVPLSWKNPRERLSVRLSRNTPKLELSVPKNRAPQACILLVLLVPPQDVHIYVCVCVCGDKHL